MIQNFEETIKYVIVEDVEVSVVLVKEPVDTRACGVSPSGAKDSDLPTDDQQQMDSTEA